MATRPKEVVDEIRDHLLSNLTDPNPRDRGDWIYTANVRLDSSMPRIKIQTLDGDFTAYSVGNASDRWEITPIQVSVFYNINNNFDVDDDGETEQPENALSMIVADVIKEIDSNQSKWQSVGDGTVHSVLLGAVRSPPAKKKNLIKKVLEFPLQNEKR